MDIKFHRTAAERCAPGCLPACVPAFVCVCVCASAGATFHFQPMWVFVDGGGGDGVSEGQRGGDCLSLYWAGREGWELGMWKGRERG